MQCTKESKTKCYPLFVYNKQLTICSCCMNHGAVPTEIETWIQMYYTSGASTARDALTT